MAQTILVVEDSATQAESLRLLLEQDGHSVLVARSAEEALELLRRRDVALVLSDVIMPGADGYELTRVIKQDMKRGDIMVVLLTTLGEPVDIIRGLACGADNYVTKPYEADILLGRVRHVLSGRDRRRAVKANVGVQVDFLGMQFTINSEKEQILDLLLSSVEDTVRTNHALQSSQRELAVAHEQLRLYAEQMRRQAQISTSRFQALMQDAWDAIFVLDAAGCIVESNARAARLIEEQADASSSAPAESLAELLVPVDRERFEAALRRLSVDQHVEVRDLALDIDAGPRRYWDVSLVIAPDEGENLVLVVAHDITERRKSEEKLRSRAVQQAAIAEIGQRALAGSDPTTLIEESLAVVSETLGVPLVQVFEVLPGGQQLQLCAGMGWRRELLGKLQFAVGPTSMAGFTISQMAPVIVENLRSERRFAPSNIALQHGAVSGMSVVIPGTHAPYGVLAAFSATSRQFDSDDVNFLRGVAATIGAAVERSRSVEALHESEERSRKILDSLSEGVVMISSSGSVEWCNSSAAEFFRTSPESVRGLTSGELGFIFYDESGTPVSIEELPSTVAMRTGECAPRLMRVGSGGATPRWVLVSARALVRTSDGVAHSAVVSFVDMHERKRMEEKLMQAQRLEAVGRLAGGVAHDFNNILTVIRSYSEVALLGVEAESDIFGDIQQIISASDRATALTRQLLTVGRRSVVRPQPVSLNDVIVGMKAMLTRLVREDIALELRLEESLPTVVADPGQLEQVLMNLVVNARDAIPGSGRIVVATEVETVSDDAFVIDPVRPGTYAVISVSDTGVGMPSALRDQIFEPFFTTKEQGSGTGLGLATVRGIVEESGGHIAVLSDEGKGTTFRAYLPLSELPARQSPVDAAKRSAVAGAGETILVAEDEESVRRVMGQELRRAGYNVLEAKSGSDALAIFREFPQRIDALVTDMIMPGLNGRELAAAALQLQPALHVLYTSGYSGDIISPENLGDPAFAFLEKPFATGELVRRLQAILECDRRPA